MCRGWQENIIIQSIIRVFLVFLVLLLVRLLLLRHFWRFAVNRRVKWRTMNVVLVLLTDILGAVIPM